MLTYKTKIKSGMDLWVYSGSEVIGSINVGNDKHYVTGSSEPVIGPYYTWHLRVSFPAQGGTENVLELAKEKLQAKFDEWCKKAELK